MPKAVLATPWDSRVFGFDTFEILHPSKSVLKKTLKNPGHYTIKIDPLSSKRLLHEHGFYYCDTLIEPFCDARHFVFHTDPKANISRSFPLKELLKISKGSYLHGRFHRDFNINKKDADQRYDNWLKDLYRSGNVFALTYNGRLAGFFGYNGPKILLHALASRFQGRGLSKFLWSVACRELFKHGHQEITSSISASNAPAHNLYISLGFRFRKTLDVYHRLVS